MTIPTSTKNNWLAGQGFDFASTHTGFPGTTGANESTGGAPAYARKAIVMNAAAGGSRSLLTGVQFDVPASTVKWIGFWNAGVFVFGVPNGGATPKNFMWTSDNVKVYAAAHGWSDTQKVTFYNGTPPAPLVEGTTYFVRDSTTNAFNVAATSGGVAIVLTTPPSFGCVVSAITEDTYSSQGTHQLTAASEVIPD